MTGTQPVAERTLTVAELIGMLRRFPPVSVVRLDLPGLLVIPPVETVEGIR